MIALPVVVTTLAFIISFVPGSETSASRDPETIALVCTAQSTVIVPVSLPGAPAQRFVLDTGASLSIVDRDLAARLGLTPSGRIPSRSGSEALVTAQLTIGTRALPSQRVVSADLGALRRLAGNVAGVLGADALHALGAVTIDYEGCTLRIGATHARRDDRVPLVWHEGRPLISTSDAGRLLIDSGASALTLFEGSAAASALQRGPTTRVRIDRIDGSGVGRVGRIPTLSLGRVDLAGIPAVVVESWYDSTERNAPDGLLPLRLFSRIYINLSEGYVVFERSSF
jgi:hypothetical protein